MTSRASNGGHCDREGDRTNLKNQEPPVRAPPAALVLSAPPVSHEREVPAGDQSGVQSGPSPLANNDGASRPRCERVKVASEMLVVARSITVLRFDQIVGDHMDEVAALLHDRQPPCIERRIASQAQVAGVEMLHVRRVDVPGRDVEAHAVTQRRVAVGALVRQIVTATTVLRASVRVWRDRRCRKPVAKHFWRWFGKYASDSDIIPPADDDARARALLRCMHCSEERLSPTNAATFVALRSMISASDPPAGGDHPRGSAKAQRLLASLS